MKSENYLKSALVIFVGVTLSAPASAADRCVGSVSGNYVGGMTIWPAPDGRGVIVTVSARRPTAYGTCLGDKLIVNFTDDHTISAVFDGRKIYWDNNTIWTRQ
jgi:hypothetical protein